MFLLWPHISSGIIGTYSVTSGGLEFGLEFIPYYNCNSPFFQRLWVYWILTSIPVYPEIKNAMHSQFSLFTHMKKILILEILHKNIIFQSYFFSGDKKTLNLQNTNNFERKILHSNHGLLGNLGLRNDWRISGQRTLETDCKINTQSIVFKIYNKFTKEQKKEKVQLISLATKL